MPIETDQQYLERVVKEQAEEIERLKETLEILNDPDTMDALADAERDVVNGHLEQFVIEETDSDEEAQDLRDGSDYQKFTQEG